MSPQYQQMLQERKTALGEAFAPQIKGLQEQITTLPQQFEAQKSALQQAKENAFRDITKTAARGGMFFTGFTPREEARYLGEKYLPGLQMLGQQETQTRQGLLDKIAQIQAQERLGGLSYLDQLAAMQRADEQEAKQAARGGGGGGGGGGIDFSALAAALGGGGGGSKAFLAQRGDKGFDFTDASGAPISAAKYAQLTGMGIGDVLYEMGKSGDKYAQQLYNQLKSDPFFGKGNAAYDARIKKAYAPIFWGT